MTIGWLTMALLAFSGNAPGVDVTVSITTEGSMTTYPAKRIASAIFRKAGLTVAWKKGPPPADAPGIWLHVTLAAGTSVDLLPGALAFAHPFGGCSKSITIFYDRIRSSTSRPDQESSLLAYVLAHEITHVLQGIDHHSETGLMKASWSPEDRSEIYSRRLAFLENDVQLMQQGVAAGCRLRAGRLTDRSE